MWEWECSGVIHSEGGGVAVGSQGGKAKCIASLVLPDLLEERPDDGQHRGGPLQLTHDPPPARLLVHPQQREGGVHGVDAVRVDNSVSPSVPRAAPAVLFTSNRKLFHPQLS